jgi:hypothetical protein
MTRYLLMIADTEPEAEPTSEEIEALIGEYYAYGDWLTAQGWDRGSEALQPSDTATTVAVRDGRRIVTDGPFAETKEQLGGYYLVEVPSLDDAIEAAARIPGARTGRVEIRPIMEFGS